MNSPIKVLEDEHEIIKSALELAIKMAPLIGVNDELYAESSSKLMVFFKTYTDKYHHQKENLILFPEMIKKYELLGEGIVKEMYENHEDFHDILNTTEELLANKEYSQAQKQFNIYAEALLDHITVENEEVFQIAESLFNSAELETLYFRCIDSDNENGLDIKRELEDLLGQIKISAQ